MAKKTPVPRTEALNGAMEALFFAFRALVARPDALLAEQGLSRVHHRILFFVRKTPNGSIGDLLATLGVSKQALNRPLRELVELGYVRAEADPGNRRIRRLNLTDAGLAFEELLSGEQRRRFAEVFRVAGPAAEAGWREVMARLADPRFD
ncbi:MarR family winged helix-turn-helix transcriptional regulator [Azospira restricta]|uniref:MarR family transcriptional regulator n=1 Tax=Azospira restricta TaxID=404405 RepID=A0A974Y5C4_9RHOO|nr:MarR family transcriptional regulator [Azospira restricta]QRJ65225.1 MarR family transcriptional regulator [Azospira restricta]